MRKEIQSTMSEAKEEEEDMSRVCKGRFERSFHTELCSKMTFWLQLTLLVLALSLLQRSDSWRKSKGIVTGKRKEAPAESTESDALFEIHFWLPALSVQHSPFSANSSIGKQRETPVRKAKQI